MRLPAVISRFGAGMSAAALTAVSTIRQKLMPGVSSVPAGGGWYRIFESFAGAWQSHVVSEPLNNLLTFSAVYSCVSLISGDIAKLRPQIMRDGEGRDAGIRVAVEANSPFWRVLRRPNHFQTWFQFARLWIISKLLHGNTYVLKIRESYRGMVLQLYILDPQRVTPLVASTGDIFYQLAADNLSKLETEITVPASEIIHDRGAPLYHPLVGVSPIVACAYSATQGIKIQRNSATFFNNMSLPSGMLTAPKKIDPETAERLKKHFESNYSGANLGRVAVAGDGLEYKQMTISAEAAQLIDQLKWTVEDVARCFHTPLYKIGGTVPAGNTVEALNQIYYTDCLQELIESMETCLDEGLGLPLDKTYGTELDLDGLIRMDNSAQIELLTKAVGGGVMTPNEARRARNLPKVIGGDAIYLQHQNYSTEALAKRDAKEDPFATSNKQPATTSPPTDEADKDDAAAKAFTTLLIAKFQAAAVQEVFSEPEEAVDG